MTILSVRDLCVNYGSVQAVRNVSIDIVRGESVAILGANGAGKSSILRCLVGLKKPSHGSITFEECNDIHKLRPHQIARLGVSWVPEGRQVLTTLTVRENLEMPRFAGRGAGRYDDRLRLMFDAFPKLKDRQNQEAGLLSGGEQQMLAIARALLLEPEVILLDEPSLGLAPKIVTEVFDLIHEINNDGVTVVMVEQNARKSLRLVDRAYVLQTGSIVASGTPEELLESELVMRAFLGASADSESVTRQVEHD